MHSGMHQLAWVYLFYTSNHKMNDFCSIPGLDWWRVTLGYGLSITFVVLPLGWQCLSPWLSSQDAALRSALLGMLASLHWCRDVACCWCPQVSNNPALFFRDSEAPFLTPAVKITYCFFPLLFLCHLQLSIHSRPVTRNTVFTPWISYNMKAFHIACLWVQAWGSVFSRALAALCCMFQVVGVRISNMVKWRRNTGWNIVT